MKSAIKKFVIPLIALLVLVALCAVGWFVFSSRLSTHKPDAVELRQEFTKKKVLGRDWTVKPAAVKSAVPSSSPAATKKPAPKRRDDNPDEDDWQEYTPEEERLVDEIRDAADEESVEKLATLAEIAVKSTNPTVRSDMVETLSGMDDKVLPELLMFMSDEDESVRTDASAAFEQAVLNMEEDADKANVIAIAMNTLKDAELVQELSEGLFDLDDQYMHAALESVLQGSNPIARKIAEEIAEKFDAMIEK